MERSWSALARPRAVGELRRAVRDFAATHGVLDPPLADIGLAVSEAVTNAVVHSYRSDATPGPVEVSARHSEHELRLVVADHGRGYGPRTDSPGMGVGMALIASVCDGVEIRPHVPRGTEIHMCFSL
jgi:serine/threonine-protein kinase RsbW/stage II sporulation protein AB (anti-sigma F factor)